MPYGNEQAPEGAPVAPPDLIGAALLLGLVSVVSISTHGAYVIALAIGRESFAPMTAADILLNVVGFVGSLWLLALRRWAWRLSLLFAAAQVGIHVYLAVHAAAAGPDWLGVGVNAFLTILFLVVLGFLLGDEVSSLIERREDYRAGLGQEAP